MEKGEYSQVTSGRTGHKETEGERVNYSMYHVKSVFLFLLLCSAPSTKIPPLLSLSLFLCASCGSTPFSSPIVLTLPFFLCVFYFVNVNSCRRLKREAAC